MRPAKIAIVGVGSVGSTTAYTLLLSGMVAEIVLIDINKEKAEGESMDLNHAAPLTSESQVRLGDWADCADAAVVIITGGANQKPGQSRMDLVAKNAKIMEQIVPNVAKNAPDTIILLATNPVDVLTYIAYKMSGFSPERVIGSATLVDSARLRYNLGQYLGVAFTNVKAFIVGEHCNNQVRACSCTSIAEMQLSNFCNESDRKFDKDALHKIYEETRDASGNII